MTDKDTDEKDQRIRELEEQRDQAKEAHGTLLQRWLELERIQDRQLTIESVSMELAQAHERIRELEEHSCRGDDLVAKAALEIADLKENLARAVEATQFAFDAVNVIDCLYCDAVDSQPGDNDAFDSLEGAIEVLSMRVQGVLRVLNVDPAKTLEWSETRKVMEPGVPVYPTTEQLARARVVFDRYRDGWRDGASVKPIASSAEEYSRGYSAGRGAFLAAMEAERERLGLPPAQKLRLQSEGRQNESNSSGVGKFKVKLSEIQQGWDPQLSNIRFIEKPDNWLEVEVVASNPNNAVAIALKQYGYRNAYYEVYSEDNELIQEGEILSLNPTEHQ